jgi:hypothetical protein
MWIKMAKECLGETNHFSEKTVVKYDDWFSSEEYRIKIEEDLDLIRDDSRLNTVMRIGHGRSWGSSFDGMKRKDSAQNMKVLSRWASEIDNPRFIKMSKNKEMIELSQRLGWERV